VSHLARTSLVLGALVLGGCVVVACSTDSPRSGFDDPNAPGKGNPGGGTLGDGGGGPCEPVAGNWDIPGNGCDDDGDGTVDNPPACDDALPPNGTAEDFAKAIGICATAAKDGYGLVSAQFTRGHKSFGSVKNEQHGVLAKFGDVLKPREGTKLGVLSTGYAQEFNGAPGRLFGGDAFGSTAETSKDWEGTGALPPGFPKASVGCPQSDEIHDAIGIELTLKAPKNASGVRFDLNFFSSEWPAYICSSFNDGFLAYLSAKGFNSGTADNISFDSLTNPVSVNNGFFDRCTSAVDIGCAPGAKRAVSQCPGGVNELRGTGYGADGKWCELFKLAGTGGDKVSTNGGATGWLTSSAPVSPGEELTLHFIVWDTGDGALDSSVLLDNFKWAEGAVTVITDRPR
jgi:hypothetical protein